MTRTAATRTLQPVLPFEMYVDHGAWLRERERVLFRSWFCVGRLARPRTRPTRTGSPSSTSWVSPCWSPRTRPARCTRRTTSAATAGRRSCPSTREPPAPTPCSTQALRCPYHSWTYGLDGRLLKAPHTEDVDDFDRDGVRPEPGRGRRVGRVLLRPPHPGGGRAAVRRGRRRVRRPAASLPSRRPRGRAAVRVRRRRQLQGARRELQRVLPLRTGPPRAVPAGPGVRAAAAATSTGPTACRTATAPGRSR